MKTRHWIQLLAACTVLALLDTVQALLRGSPGPMWLIVLEHAATWYPLAFIVPLIVRLALRFPLEGRTLSRNNALHVAAALLFPLVHVGVAMLGWYWVLIRREPDLDPIRQAGMVASYMYTMEFLLYWLVVGGTQARRYYVELRARELQTARLKASLTDSKLQALRSQLQPHFLFNTLNSISVLAEQGENARVRRMTNRLADLLRLSLDSTAQTVSLREELAFVERYLLIEQERFGERLAVAWEVGEAVLDAAVPSLLLQPLVENAVKHGFGRSQGAVRITIQSWIEGDALVVVVDDTGPGLARGAGGDIRENVGLRTTRARLQELYGAGHELRLLPGPEGGTRAFVRIPYERLDRPASYIRWSHEYQGDDRGRRAPGALGHPTEARTAS